MVSDDSCDFNVQKSLGLVNLNVNHAIIIIHPSKCFYDIHLTRNHVLTFEVNLKIRSNKGSLSH